MSARKKWIYGLAILLFFGGGAVAEANVLGDSGDEFTMDIHISGTVVAIGACTFTQKGPVAVNFGDVEYSTAGGAHLNGSYVKTLDSGMTCSGDSAGHAQMKVDTAAGTDITYNGQTLLPVNYTDGTTSPSLGIGLTVNGIAQNVGEWFDVDMTRPPALEARLIQVGDGKDFVSGLEFSESATLIMAFN